MDVDVTFSSLGDPPCVEEVSLSDSEPFLRLFTPLYNSRSIHIGNYEKCFERI